MDLISVISSLLAIGILAQKRYLDKLILWNYKLWDPSHNSPSIPEIKKWCLVIERNNKPEANYRTNFNNVKLENLPRQKVLLVFDDTWVFFYCRSDVQQLVLRLLTFSYGISKYSIVFWREHNWCAMSL